MPNLHRTEANTWPRSVSRVFLLIRGGALAFRGLDGARGLWMKRECIARLVLLMEEGVYVFQCRQLDEIQGTIKRKR